MPLDPESLKQIDWAEVRTLGPRLAQVTEELNEALLRCEEAFEDKLGTAARGRVELERGEHRKRARLAPDARGRPRWGPVTDVRPWVVLFVYRDGEFFIESNKGGSSRFETTHLLSASRELRFQAARKLKELWIACGGDPRRTASSPET